MWEIFKTNPAKKLQKKHAALLAEAHRMSAIDRSKSDALVAQAADVETELMKVLSKKA